MQRSFIRPAALACITAALAFMSAGAFAQASITLNDPNCVSFTLTGNPPNQTLNCVQSATPLCTISGPAGGTIGTPIAVNTTTCVPAATSYLWSGGNCGGQATKNCADPGTGYANNQVVNYSVVGTNLQGAGPASNVQATTWTNTPPALPSGCTIVQTNPSGTLPVGGGNPTLTASCTGGNPVTWSWQGGFAQGMTTAIVSGSVTSTTQFTATATNGGGSTPTNITVTVSNGGGGISCTGFNRTLVLDENWNNPVRLFTSSAGGFGPNDALVVRFTTGPNTNPWTSGSTSGKKGGIGGAEYGSQPSFRVATLSASPCDFGNGMFPPGTQVLNQNTIALSYSVGGNHIAGYYAVLQPSTTYYFNVKNSPASTCSGDGNCNMFIDFSKPDGL